MIRQISITYLEDDENSDSPVYRLTVQEAHTVEDLDEDNPDLIIRGVTFAGLNELIGHRTRDLIHLAIHELKTL